MGTLTLDTSFDLSGAKKSYEQLERATQEVAQSTVREIASIGGAFDDVSKSAQKSSKAMEGLDKKQIASMERRIATQKKQYNELLQQRKALLDEGEKERAKYGIGLGETEVAPQIAKIEERLISRKEKILQLEQQISAATSETAGKATESTKATEQLVAPIKKASDGLEDAEIIWRDTSQSASGVYEYVEEISTAAKDMQESFAPMPEVFNEMSTQAGAVGAALGTGMDSAADAVAKNKALLEKITQFALDKAAIQAANSELGATSEKLGDIESAKETISDTDDSVKTMASSLAGYAKTAIGAIGNIIQKIGGGMKSIGTKISGFMKSSQSSTGGLTKGIERLWNRLKRLAGTVLIFNAIRKAFRAFSDYMSTALKANKEFSASWGAVKGNISATFQPILQSVIPILSTLVSWLSTATSAILQFMAALSGKSVKALQASAKGMDDLAASTGGAGSAAKKALAPFDELTQLSTAAGGGGGGAGGIETVYEDVPEPNLKWLEFVEKLKALVPDLEYFYTLGYDVGNRIADGLNNIPWETIRAWSISFTQKMAAFLNGTVASDLIPSVGRTIGEAINTALTIAYTWLTTFDFLAFGIRIGDGLNEAINKINWPLLGSTIGAWFMSTINTIHGAITRFNWIEAGAKLASMMNSLFGKIKWGEVGQTISDGIKGALAFLTKGVEDFNWKALGEDVREFLEGIDWAGIWEAFKTFLSTVFTGFVEFLAGLLGNEGDLSQIEDIAKAIIAVFAGLIVANIALSLAMGGVTLASLPLILAVFAIGAAIAATILYWEDINQALYDFTDGALGAETSAKRLAKANNVMAESQEHMRAMQLLGTESSKKAFDQLSAEYDAIVAKGGDVDALRDWQHKVLLATEETGAVMLLKFGETIEAFDGMWTYEPSGEMGFESATKEHMGTGVDEFISSLPQELQNAWDATPSGEMGMVTAVNEGLESVTDAAKKTKESVETSLGSIPEVAKTDVMAPLADEYSATFSGIASDATEKVDTPLSDMFTRVAAESVEKMDSAAAEITSTMATMATDTNTKSAVPIGLSFDKTATDLTAGMTAAAANLTNALSTSATDIDAKSAAPIAESFADMSTNIVNSSSEAVTGMKAVFSGFPLWITINITSKIEDAFATLAKGLKAVFNSIIATSNTMLSNITSGINSMVDAVNGIRIKIPAITAAGGVVSAASSVSPSANRISIPSIPALATGTIVPPNKEFMAILGDNTAEHEVVSPVSVMKQTFLEAMAEGNYGGSGGVTIEASGDLGAIIRLMNFRLKKEQQREGGRMSNRVVPT